MPEYPPALLGMNGFLSPLGGEGKGEGEMM